MLNRLDFLNLLALAPAAAIPQATSTPKTCTFDDVVVKGNLTVYGKFVLDPGSTSAGKTETR